MYFLGALRQFLAINIKSISPRLFKVLSLVHFYLKRLFAFPVLITFKLSFGGRTLKQ